MTGVPQWVLTVALPAGIALVAAVVLGFYCHASSLHVVSSALVIINTIILFVVALGLRSASNRKGQTDYALRMLLRYSALIGAAAILSLVIGWRVQAGMMKEAKAWCEAQLPAIEAYRNQHGNYPRSLAVLVDPASVPADARAFDVELNGGAGEFSLILYTGSMSGWGWHSGRRAWLSFEPMQHNPRARSTSQK